MRLKIAQLAAIHSTLSPTYTNIMADQTGLSFEIKDAYDLFGAFCESINDFTTDELSTRKAVVCAMLGWHVADWLYAEHPHLAVNLNAFQRRVRAECSALSYMRDVATATKHGSTHWEPAVKATETHGGAFSRGFSRDFDVPCLRLAIDGERWVYFDDQLAIARTYWEQFFNQIRGAS